MDRMQPGSPGPVTAESERPRRACALPLDGAGPRSGPLISLIVPVYNVAEHLGQCLDSITRQAFRDIEIIAVDGASDDTSGKILDERSQEEPRLTVLHEKRIVLGRARNEGAGRPRASTYGSLMATI
jgi:cellulose synthase/poly-beta-1,6-N-acetylglucosamine synthase-like glycosyltransferase